MKKIFLLGMFVLSGCIFSPTSLKNETVLKEEAAVKALEKESMNVEGVQDKPTIRQKYISDNSVYRIGFRTHDNNAFCYGDIPKKSTLRNHKHEEQKQWDGVVCDIAEPGEPVQNKPEYCESDWGGRVELAAMGHAKNVCAGDTLASYKLVVLEVGETVKGNGWVCTNKKSSLTCINSEKHGFSIGKKTQKFFNLKNNGI